MVLVDQGSGRCIGIGGVTGPAREFYEPPTGVGGAASEVGAFREGVDRESGGEVREVDDGVSCCDQLEVRPAVELPNKEGLGVPGGSFGYGERAGADFQPSR